MGKFRMDESQKRYFCVLCSTGNMTQAAKTLYISRQGLSKSINSLEKNLDAQLFIRGKKGVELTQEGRTLLRYIHEEDRLWDGCLADLRTLRKTNSELIRVGLLSMFFGYAEKHALFASFQDDPRMQIEIVDGDHSFFWQQIVAGKMEFAFSIKPPEDLNLPTIKLNEDSLVILLNIDDPLAKKDYVDFESDLRGKTVIQTSPYKGKLYETTLANYGITSEPITHDKNLMLARVSTSNDCFIIQSEYAKELITDRVCMRPLINAHIEMDTMFVFRPDLGPMAQIVAKEMIRAYGKAEELDAFFSQAST